MCTCIFLLRQEFFNIILINNLSFFDGGVTRRTESLKFVVGFQGSCIITPWPPVDFLSLCTVLSVFVMRVFQ
jgi:hypothetical protein